MTALFTAGESLTAAKLNSALGVSASDPQDTGGTTTSISYTATLTTGTICSTTFVAPLSGKVRLVSSTQMSNSGANYNYMSPQVKSGSTIGSGATILAASDANAAINNGTVAQNFSRATPLGGLTPGDTYNVQWLCKVSAGTGTFTHKVGEIVPV